MPQIPAGTYMFAQSTNPNGIVTGVRWRRKVVRYRIVDDVLYLPFMRTQGNAVRKAIGMWQKALEPYVTFMEVEIERAADITIRLVTPKLTEMFGGEAGHTDLHKDPLSAVEDTTEAQTWIKGWLCWPFSRLDTLTVALHEFGHVIGIRGHPISYADPDSVMLDPMTGKRDRPSRADMATAKWVYENK